MPTTGAKKILLIIPNLGRGGAQTIFREQLEFYSQNYKTVACVFNFDDAFAEDRHLDIHSLDIPAGTTLLGKFLSFWRRVIAVRKIKKRYDIDFCISHLEGADYVNVLSKRKEKTICWIHGSKLFDENISGIIGTLRKKVFIPFAYKLADQLVTVSDGIRQELINGFALSSQKTLTIYNGFDIADIDLKSAQPIPGQHQELFKTKTIVIAHCRLAKQKNVSAMIDIFKSIKNNSAIRLVILGDGELREELIRYCYLNELRAYSVWGSNTPFNLDYHIYFLGYERNPYAYLRMAKLYLMTSSWEGFPLSLCEAMACRVLVMSSDCFTGPREIISPGLEHQQPVEQVLISAYGILMPLATQSHLSAWAETIVTILGNNVLQDQLQQAGRDRVLTFDKRKINAEWLRLIEQHKNFGNTKGKI